METFLWIFSSGITLGCIYAFVALGFVIVYSMTKIFNLAVGAFVMLGALLAITFYESGLPLPLSIILGLIANCAIAAVAWLAFLHRPYSRQESQWTLLLIVAVLLILITSASYIVWGIAPKSLPYFTDFKPIIEG